MTGTMLVTGATGVVGSEMVRVGRAAGWEVVGCSRRGGDDVVRWDMTEPAPRELRRSWDVVVHTAARPRWTMPAEQAWSANVEPVRTVSELIGPETRTVLLSTAYVTGFGDSPESPDLADYRNTYEWSKAGAERLAGELIGPAAVLRPPLVVGARADGSVARFTGMYTFLSALTSSRLPALVAEPTAPIDIVSTTDIADCCLRLVTAPTWTERVETLGRGASALSVEAALQLTEETVNRWRAERGRGPLPWPRFVSPEAWDRLYRPMAARAFGPRQLRILDLLEPFIPYLSADAPLPVTWTVDPMEDCLVACTEFWLQTHAASAMRALKPWARESGDAEEHAAAASV